MRSSFCNWRRRSAPTCTGRAWPPPPPREDDDGRRRFQAPQNRRPGQCFNHQDRPVLHKCEDCNEGFCADCVVRFQGHTLCGPCKNFRLRRTDRSATLSGKALTAVILAMCAAPAVACLWPFGMNGIVAVMAILALMAQGSAIVLGVLALRETENNPRLGGRAL